MRALTHLHPWEASGSVNWSRPQPSTNYTALGFQQMLASYYLTNMLIITFLSNNSMVAASPDPFSLQRVWLVGLPQDPLLSLLIFSASSTDNKDAFHYGKHLSLFEFCVK